MQKLKKKAPKWLEKGVLGLDKKNIEQSSSSLTAGFKFKTIKVKKSLDLTGGYGVDSYYLSRHAEVHHYCEPSRELAQVVAYNFKKLDVKNVVFHQQNAESFMREQADHEFDLIFLDPDRRPSENQRKYQLSELKPNILQLQDVLLKKTPIVIYKLSPLCDLKNLISVIKGLHKVQILSLYNEVKEINAFATKQETTSINFELANYKNGQWYEEFFPWPFNFSKLSYSEPLQYIYEPHAGLMKSQAWDYIAYTYQLKKIAPQSHYFTSNEPVKYFPGRILKLVKALPFQKKNFKLWQGGSFSVLSRNFGVSAEELKKRFKVKENAEQFLIFTRDLSHQKIVLIAYKIY